MPVISIDLTPFLPSGACDLKTRRIVLEQGLLSRVAVPLRDVLPPGIWLLVADEKTWGVAGAKVAAGLERAGIHTRRYLVTPAAGEIHPVADDVAVEGLAAHLRLAGAGIRAVVAVGAGTINDIVKLAAHRAGLPGAVVATAPSMNGYTSGIAAILSRGVKTTQPCHPPVACLADLDILARAPYRMIAAGLGDLVSRSVSCADWRLSHLLLGSDYFPRAEAFIEASACLLEGVPDRLPQRDVEAVGRLMGSLCLSGLAMSAAGSSAPASGGEHLISHFLDMTHPDADGSHDLHGCQVGVATITTAALYEHLIALDPATIDVEVRLAAQRPWLQWAADLERCFGKLAPAVLPEAREAYPTPEELRQRLMQLKGEWSPILADLGRALRPARQIRAELQSGQAPLTFAQIGVSPARARQAILYSKAVRARYTILDLAAELGRLEEWADAVLAEFHDVSL